MKQKVKNLSQSPHFTLHKRKKERERKKEERGKEGRTEGRKEGKKRTQFRHFYGRVLPNLQKIGNPTLYKLLHKIAKKKSCPTYFMGLLGS